MEREEIRANEEALIRKSKRSLSTADSSIYFIPHNCKGCGLCVDACPTGVLQLYEDPGNKWGVSVKVEAAEYCIGCKMCERQCPDFAIFISSEKCDSKKQKEYDCIPAGSR